MPHESGLMPHSAGNRVVLAYSGGPSSTAVLEWLVERSGAEVVTVTLDLGQGREIDAVREQARAMGAVRAHVFDRAGALVSDVIWPLMQVGVDPVQPAEMLAAPLIARALMEVARLEQASAVAHGARGGDARRMDMLLGSLAGDGEPLDEPRDPGVLRLPAAVVEEAGYRGEGIRVATTIWGRTLAGGMLRNGWLPVPDHLFAAIRPAARCPDDPASLEITFERGIPVAVNGVDMPLVELVGSVATIAGAHGVGRREVWVERTGTGREREVHESPAATVLAEAHRALASLVLDERYHAFCPQIAAQYLALAFDGAWFSPFRRSLDASRLDAEARVNGTVRLSLFKGGCQVVGQRVPQYDRAEAGAVAG